MTREEAVKIFLEKTLKAYREDQAAKDITASGASAASLRTDQNEQGGKLFGVGYFKYQFSGRKPGKMPPIDAILNWINVKGIATDTTEKGLLSFAFAIAKKIAKSGTDIFQSKRPGLNVDEKILEYRKELVQNIISSVKHDMKESVEKLKARA